MDRRNSQRGYTVLELFIVVFVIGILFVGVVMVGVGICGNQWYTEGGVLRELQIQHPNATKVMASERNVFAGSRVTVEQEGKPVVYCFGSNIMFNYTFEDCGD
jgi:hypothetical protein